MRVILISPPSPWLISDRVSNFLGILYIAAYLREQNVDVRVVDLASIPEEHWYFPKGDIYGVTCTSPHFIYAKKIAEKVRQRDENAMLVIGGVHPTSIPDKTLNESLFDIAVLGEGEQTMLEIAQDRPLHEVEGICYKKDGKLLFTRPRPLIKDLDSLPYPARDMIDTHSYLRTDVMGYLGEPRGSGELSMITSRGCPYNCCYCSQSLMTGRLCRFNSVEKVIGEVKLLIREYGVGRINFVDDMFTTNKTRLLGLCAGLKELGIEWQCLSRADDVSYGIMKVMGESGCVGITFGIESGSQKILDRAGKRIKVEQSRKGIVEAKKAGLKVRSQMMVGLPGEDDVTVAETAEFIRTTPSDVWSVHIFVPFPGCDVWKNSEKYNFPIDQNTDFSDYHTVGKPGEWKNIINPQKEKVARYKEILLEAAGERNIYRYVK